MTFGTKHYFRIQRFLLTPLVQRVLVYVLPLGFVIAIASVVLVHNGNYKRFADFILTEFNTFMNRPENLVIGLKVVAPSNRVHSELVSLVNQKFPQSAASFNLDELRRKAKNIPAVMNVRVSIEPGGLLTIKADEFPAAVIFRHPKGLMVLNEIGQVLAQPDSRTEYNQLPLITGEGAELFVQESLEIFASSKKFFNSIRGLVRIGERRWDIILDGERRVKLPANDPVGAIERLLELNEKQLLLQRQLAIVDLRSPERTVIRLTNNDII